MVSILKLNKHKLMFFLPRNKKHLIFDEHNKLKTKVKVRVIYLEYINPKRVKYSYFTGVLEDLKIKKQLSKVTLTFFNKSTLVKKHIELFSQQLLYIILYL